MTPTDGQTKGATGGQRNVGKKVTKPRGQHVAKAMGATGGQSDGGNRWPKEGEQQVAIILITVVAVAVIAITVIIMYHSCHG